MLPLATDVSGIVASIAVRENQPVREGDILVRLDDLPFRLALARAEAQLATARNDVAAMKDGYADMTSQIAQADADLVYFQRDFARQQDLAARQVAAQSTLDQSRRALAVATQHIAALRHQRDAIAATLGGNPEIDPADHPKVRDATAARDEAARQLAHATIRAPMDGIVTNVASLQRGQYLAAAATAFNLVATGHVWVLANPKETELTHIAQGQRAEITVDTYPGEVWEGTVESISPASGASFALLPAQNTSGNWVKVVQRIPMRIRIATPEGRPPLRVGMSVTVAIDTGHPRGLPDFLARLFTPGEPARAAARPDG
jgi:membrane fusion protein (multidrug efflux system)